MTAPAAAESTRRRRPAGGGPGAAYASNPGASRGRAHPEAETPGRSPFQRDRDRIVHSTAFRRLQDKTQVFVQDRRDHYRTRLTHSLEVAQIARTVALNLDLDEALAETLALAHDLGHPPFGHAGEEALNAELRGIGGFDHNIQTLRIVGRLESRYAGFDGLNLTWETIEGLAKHNGPVASDVPPYLLGLDRALNLELGSWPSLEAQVASLADDIAYANHDIDDGLRAGLIAPDPLRDLPVVGPCLAEVETLHGGLERHRLAHETVRRSIGAMVGDLVAETRRRIAEAGPASSDEVRTAEQPLAAFSASMADDVRTVKSFLFENVYRHPRVVCAADGARRIVVETLEALRARPAELPPEWRRGSDGPGGARTGRIAADYVAGMTDRYAFREHRRLRGPGPAVR